MAERLIKVRLDHPIAACLERGEALKRRFGLRQVEVVPIDPMGSSTTVGIAEAGAAEIHREALVLARELAKWGVDVCLVTLGQKMNQQQRTEAASVP